MARDHRFFSALLAPIVLFLVLVVSFLPSSLARAWSTDPTVNTPICTSTDDQCRPTIVSDGSGGAIIIWETSYPSGDIYAERIDSTGALMWAAEGVSICTAVGHQSGVKAVSDGYGGAVIVWHDYRSGSFETDDIYAQRVNAAGATQWADNGIAICIATGHKLSIGATSDGSGGAIIAWENQHSGSDSDLYAQRVNAAGVTQWAANGIAVCTAASFQSQPVLIPDGSGGAIISWIDSRGGSPDIYAQRIGSLGALEWADNGVAVCTAAGSQINVGAAGNGPTGTILVWQDDRSGEYRVYVQKVDLSGGSQWTIDGVAVCTFACRQENPVLTADGSGGTIVTWEDRNGGESDCYAQKVDSAGALQWAETGVAICTAVGDQWSIRIVGDDSGGAIIAWEDRRGGLDAADIYAQRVTSSGTVGWTENGATICTAEDLQFSPAMTEDGSGGAIVTWQDRRNDGANDVYAQAIDAEGGLNGVAPRPSQPVNVSPGSGTANVSPVPTLESSTFSGYGPGDTHTASEWQIRTSAGRYASPTFDSGTDVSHLTEITLQPGILDDGTTYYWRVRHKDNHGAWSNWSIETSFTTLSLPNHPPSQPSNTSPTDAATGAGLTPTLRSSDFSDPDAGDTHAASQWQLRTSTGSYSNPLYDSGPVTIRLTSVIIPSGKLDYGATYYWSVRHQDNHGEWSAYSAETSFTTAAYQPPDEPDIPSNIRVTDLACTADGAEYWAIVVAVSDYLYFAPRPPSASPYETYDLPYADDDANALYERLLPICGEDHMKLLVDAAASKSGVRDAILDWLAPHEGPEDAVLFYFSGHGNSEYIAPYDALTTSNTNDIHRRELDTWLDSLESTRLLAVVDSCHSGGFINSSEGTGRVLMASSTEAEFSWETSTLGHGVFTYYLLEGLEEAHDDQAHYAADTNEDHVISAEEVFYYLEPLVTQYMDQEWGESQHPILYDGYQGDLALAAYRTQYYLNVETDHGVPEGAGWYDDGGEAAFGVPQSVDGGEGTRYAFASWNDGNTSPSREVILSEPMTFIAGYKTQYYLKVISQYGVPGVDGWWDSGSEVMVSVPSVVEGEEGIRYSFTSWSDGNTSASRAVSISEPITLTASYTTQYHLAVMSGIGDPQGDGWYDSGSRASFLVASSLGTVIRRVFDGWEGDSSERASSATILMDGPKSVTARWGTDYTRLYIIVGGALSAAVAALAVTMMMRRKHKPLGD